MSYLSQNITLDNFSTILQATDNLKEESSIAIQILLIILENAREFLKDNSEYESIQWNLDDPYNVKFKDSDNYTVFTNPDNNNLSFKITQPLHSYADFLRNCIFLNNDDFLYMTNLTKKDITRLKKKFNKELTEIPKILLDEELISFESYVTDIKKWNEQSFHAADLVPVLWTVNTVLNYKCNKIFYLNILELSDNIQNLVFNNINNSLSFNTSFITNEKQDSALKVVNMFIKNYPSLISTDVSKMFNDIQMNITMHRLTASCSTELKKIGELFIIEKEKQILKNSLSNDIINKVKNRL